MPYGIDKEHGGDSPENVAKVERCVMHVCEADKSLDKSAAIAICKKSIFGLKKKP